MKPFSVACSVVLSYRVIYEEQAALLLRRVLHDLPELHPASPERKNQCIIKTAQMKCKFHFRREQNAGVGVSGLWKALLLSVDLIGLS